MNISRRKTNYDWNDCKFTMSAKTAFSAFSKRTFTQNSFDKKYTFLSLLRNIKLR